MHLHPSFKHAARRFVMHTVAGGVMTLPATVPVAQAQNAGVTPEVVVPQMRNTQGGLGCQPVPAGSWHGSRFELAAGESLQLTIQLRY